MTREIGNLGEQLVCNWLQSKSYRILHQKWHCRWGEIDIIAEDKNSPTLVFVEVKTRNNSNWDNYGLDAVSASKQQKISKSAALFLSRNTKYINFYMRFDVAAVKYQKVHNYRQLDILSECRLQRDIENPVEFNDRFMGEIANGYSLEIVNYLENAFEFI